MRIRVDEDGSQVFSPLRDSCWLVSQRHNPTAFSKNHCGWSNSGFSFTTSGGETIYLSWRALIGLAFGHESKSRESYWLCGEIPLEGSHFCDETLCVNFRHFCLEPNTWNCCRRRGCSRHLKNFSTKRGLCDKVEYQIKDSATFKIYCKGKNCQCPCHSEPLDKKCFWYENTVELGESAEHTRAKVVEVIFHFGAKFLFFFF